VPEVHQSEQEPVWNVEFELSARPDAAPSSLPQEGRAVRTGPQGLKLFSEAREFAGVQAAERLEGPGTLHEARHLKHVVTLANSPQLRNRS
jgi:glucan biosynthesis protein